MHKNYMTSPISFPNGKDFIFTIFDDTDVATLEYIRPIYDLLTSIDLRTTKSVWPLPCNDQSDYRGSHTLQDKDYASYVKELKTRGFEIAYHGPSMVSSDRDDTIRSLRIYHEVIGEYPRIYAPHARNRENIYWGRFRFTIPLIQSLYMYLSKEPPDYYSGHNRYSTYFWGDICRQHFNYVRNFTYDEINLLRICNRIIYRDPRKPFVNCWFISSDADNVNEFNRLLSEENQDRLERERGICIITTHFGKGFIREGKVHESTQRVLDIMSKRNGWFVPVSTVLDFIVAEYGCWDLSYKDRVLLEVKWFLHSLLRKRKALSYDKTEMEYLTA